MINLDSYADEILDAAQGNFDLLRKAVQKIGIEEGVGIPEAAIRAFAEAHGIAVTVARAATDNPVPGYSAPFLFVALNQKVALPRTPVDEAWKKGTLHSVPLKDGLCGRLDVTWEFDGPMLIGNGQKDPAPLKIDGTPVLPGATLRGLVRSTMEIAALGRLEQIDGHLTFGIRDFEHDLFKSDGRRQVNAGWLRPCAVPDSSPSGYEIAPCAHHLVKIRTIRSGMNTGAAHLEWLKLGLTARYERVGQWSGGLGDFSRTENFSITRTLRNGETVVEPDAKGTIKGTFVFSDKSPSMPKDPESFHKTEDRVAAQKIIHATIALLDAQDAKSADKQHKKVEHVFGPAAGTPIPLSNGALKDFLRMNCTSTGRGFEGDWLVQALREGGHEKGPLRAQSNWKHLQPTLANARAIPVFYVGTPGTPDFDFGLVRVFKRRRAHSPLSLLPEAHHVTHETPPDFVQTLMGFLRESSLDEEAADTASGHANRHLRSRLSFGFVRQIAGGGAPREVTTIQAQPSPSYGPFYLKGGRKDWNDKDELAGRKRYPAFGGTAEQVFATLANPDDDTLPVRKRQNISADVKSKLTFLTPAPGQNLRFAGQIRFHNVTPEELGALIWVLTLGGDARLRHAIGRAKAQGAGQARVVALTLSAERNDGAPLTGTPEAWEADFAAQGNAALAPFVAAFGDEMRLTERSWPDIAPVNELLGSADPGQAAHRQRYYMKVGDFATLRREVYKTRGGGPRLLAPKPGRSTTGRR